MIKVNWKGRGKENKGNKDNVKNMENGQAKENKGNIETNGNKNQ